MPLSAWLPDYHNRANGELLQLRGASDDHSPANARNRPSACKVCFSELIVNQVDDLSFGSLPSHQTPNRLEHPWSAWLGS
jgi:hypothetical protein